MTTTTLILGGTGKTGRRVADRLRARGMPVRLGSRTGTPRFEWNDPDSWVEPLRDVAAVYLVYYPDLAIPGAAEQVGAFASLAVTVGVRRIVLLSGRGEPNVLASEAAVRASGAELTVLRSAFMCQNFSEGFLVDGISAGEVRFPAGTVTEPFVDAEDIADVAVAALLGHDHVGATYDLTGPSLLSFAEATHAIGHVLQRPIGYHAVSSEDYARELTPHLPPPVVTFLVELFREVLDGHNSHVSNDIERVLGRPARTFRAYAEATALTGAWPR